MTAAATRPPQMGRPTKRVAIGRAARVVFSREGYTRASVESIAAEACVSKRTIYNHYRDKEHLLLDVLSESTHELAAHHEEVIDRHLDAPDDLRSALVALGRALATPQSGFDEHFALVRVIFAEASRLPAEVTDSWRRDGPQRTQERLTERFTALSGDGRLHAPDPRAAAAHFTQLVTSEPYERSFHGALPLPGKEVDALVGSGVDAFLQLHGADTRA
ncbi:MULTISPECIES: TetR/AcrR family transcriptional regulator [unclassified Streptomyces]|uniref:TetR/AcrR family transcriptional regulator n=1 Tax=unclassified Streptomyces TaxID=2593676 RepID=UPI00278BCE2C|nr:MULTISPECIES: TetR/AcrR family transcriptional regulator [unclassified Streptomyces]